MLVPNDHTMWFVAVCQYVTQLDVSSVDGNLLCTTLSGANTNTIGLLSVHQRKVGICMHSVGMEIDWYSECDPISHNCPSSKSFNRSFPPYISLLSNNGVTQSRHFHGTLGFFFPKLLFPKYGELKYRHHMLFSCFPCSRTKSRTGLRIEEQ